ncbi:hypothetical protein CLU79DRAFT_838594 [Phycomyces nitens]|nr:hypothetical protein CLU79DRAFT_838594 [Phycomyces nitens]
MSLGFFLNEDVAETYKQNRQLNLSREILSFLPHLRTLELGGLHSDPQIISAILEILNSFRVPLKRLDIHLLLDESETALKERVITLTKFFTRSLKILHLFMGYDRSRLANYTTVVGQYLQLVELHISNNGHSIEIDRLLDQCPRLESLMVSKAFLTFKQFDQDRPRPHNLSKLDLQSMNLCPKTMYYISWRCRQLRNLKLTSIRIREDCFDETRYVLLDIPFSQLNEITITDIICNTTHSRLFVIRQLESPKTNWYHLCKVRTGKKAMGCGWALDKDDISACEKYFEKFKPKPTPERFSNKISADHTYKLLPKTGWKKDRQNGFIKIRCRSVKNCYLSSLYCT